MKTAAVLLWCLLVSSLMAMSGEVMADEGALLSFSQAAELSANNPRVELAQEKIAAAAAKVQEAKGAWYPKLSALTFVAPSPDIECATADCTRTTPDDPTIALSGVFAGAEFTLVQPLYTSGKISSAHRAARHGVSIAQSQAKATRASQIADTARAFYGAKLARELTWMLEDGREEIAKAAQLLDEKLEEGSSDATLQDKLRLDVLTAEVDARIAEARQESATALAGLRALTGAPQATLEVQTLRMTELDLANSAATFVQRFGTKRAELLAAENTRAAAQDLIDFETAQLLPNLALVARLAVSRAQGVDDPPSAFADNPFNRTSAGVALVLRWDLDPAVQKARRDHAQARKRQADALVSIVNRALIFELESSYARAKAAKARFAASLKGERSTRAWIASILQAQAIGLAESKDLSDAYVAHFTMRARLLQAIHDWNITVIELRRAAGSNPIGSE